MPIRFVLKVVADGGFLEEELVDEEILHTFTDAGKGALAEHCHPAQ